MKEAGADTCLLAASSISALHPLSTCSCFRAKSSKMSATGHCVPDIALASPAKRAQRPICPIPDGRSRRFYHRENIERYRGLAGESPDSTGRSRIVTLLAEEESKSALGVSRKGDAPEGPVNAATDGPVEHDGEGQH